MEIIRLHCILCLLCRSRPSEHAYRQPNMLYWWCGPGMMPGISRCCSGKNVSVDRPEYQSLIQYWLHTNLYSVRPKFAGVPLAQIWNNKGL
ncbi:hypothetical protein M752DRAFT_121316 [Aspergillus phoenicis ATCC 13157]|uniref:Uncharacterized protein n=1 Tax=Aspergillus phoenicis ATCC 13157 TaxID=1353007 RepID=A0A370PU27_ASPPH|nr:hypothetical protein M752DRAFT_121316 [Aspergillus phoenicis ATCC 13157]